MIELTEMQTQALRMLARKGDWVVVSRKNTEHYISSRTLEALARRGLAQGGFPNGILFSYKGRITEAGVKHLAEMDAATERAIATARVLFGDTQDP